MAYWARPPIAALLRYFEITQLQPKKGLAATYLTARLDIVIPLLQLLNDMMTSSNENIFCVTGHFAGISPVTGEFPAQRPVTRSFNVFFDLRLNKRLSKQSRGWWFGTQPCPLWRHCNNMIRDLRKTAAPGCAIESTHPVGHKMVPSLAHAWLDPTQHDIPYNATTAKSKSKSMIWTCNVSQLYRQILMCNMKNGNSYITVRLPFYTETAPFLFTRDG